MVQLMGSKTGIRDLTLVALQNTPFGMSVLNYEAFRLPIIPRPVTEAYPYPERVPNDQMSLE